MANEIGRCYLEPCPKCKKFRSVILSLSDADERCNEIVNGCEIQGAHLHYHCISCPKKWAAVVVTLASFANPPQPVVVEKVAALEPELKEHTSVAKPHPTAIEYLDELWIK